MRGAASIAVLGTSWGGLNALSRILAGVPADFPLPIVVVQHRGRDAAGLLGELLQATTPLTVREVEDKEPIVAGTVHLAPPDYHLLVEQGYFSLSVDPPVRFSRPSIDVTFGSASDAYGAGVIGVVLTGANDDGAGGLRCIVDRGGRALVQDPETAESGVMPRAALRSVPEAEVVPLDAIAGRLTALSRVEEAA